MIFTTFAALSGEQVSVIIVALSAYHLKTKPLKITQKKIESSTIILRLSTTILRENSKNYKPRQISIRALSNIIDIDKGDNNVISNRHSDREQKWLVHAR